MRDRESTNLEAAAYLAREADPGWDDRPSPSEYMEWDEYEMPCPVHGGALCGDDDCLAHGCIEARDTEAQDG